MQVFARIFSDNGPPEYASNEYDQRSLSLQTKRILAATDGKSVSLSGTHEGATNKAA